MKIHFNFTPAFKYNLRDALGGLAEDPDFIKYLNHMAGVPIRMEMKPAIKKNSKQALYDYLYGPLMSVAIQAYTDAGYELMDAVKCDYLLKCECAKGIMMTPEGEKIFLLDKAKMSKKRLVKYVNDIIVHLEMNLSVPHENIPDASLYKEIQKTGRPFRSVKHVKK